MARNNWLYIYYIYISCFGPRVPESFFIWHKNHLVSFPMTIPCHRLPFKTSLDSSKKKMLYPWMRPQPTNPHSDGTTRLIPFYWEGCWRYLHWQMTGGAIPQFSAGGLSPHRRAAEKTFQKGSNKLVNLFQKVIFDISRCWCIDI